MSREALVVGINQYSFFKDTPTSKAKNLTTPATDAEAIAQLLEAHNNFRVTRLPVSNINGKLQVDPDKPLKIEELEKAILNLFLPESEKPPETALSPQHQLLLQMHPLYCQRLNPNFVKMHFWEKIDVLNYNLTTKYTGLTVTVPVRFPSKVLVLV
ncbi:hypothetical protein WA1_02655 [Scytonema hofmannii PCC 7110]|uniref:Uncharacterized protein n=1 Tax=Scytonema hofmannii PCC 7110 TaxID=128403 RepID=A0A139XH90_9CYAN|nr:caspase family protein [Scytonema hofmannii]KYC44060.1 hypothetical protein WA1_02655 [Scytonema hofmannii PCC 7110]